MLFVNVPIGLVALFVARYVLPETARNRGHFDLTGALTSTLGMVGLVYGFVHAAESGWTLARDDRLVRRRARRCWPRSS